MTSNANRSLTVAARWKAPMSASVILRRLSLGLVLIALTSGVLLVSDWSHRNVAEGKAVQETAGRVYQVGLVYIGPDPAIDLTVGGLFDGFRELGLVEGKNLALRQAHAAGELGNIPAVLQSFEDRKSVV